MRWIRVADTFFDATKITCIQFDIENNKVSLFPVPSEPNTVLTLPVDDAAKCLEEWERQINYEPPEKPFGCVKPRPPGCTHLVPHVEPPLCNLFKKRIPTSKLLRVNALFLIATRSVYD